MSHALAQVHDFLCARQPTTIRYVDTEEHNYELLTSRFEMWDQALTDESFGPSVVLRIRDQGSACQVP
jgi:hypothetical protein